MSWKHILSSDGPALNEWRRDALSPRMSTASSTPHLHSPSNPSFPERPSRTPFRFKAFYQSMLVLAKRILSIFQPSLTRLQDPTCVSHNALPKHAPLRLFSSPEEALSSGLLQGHPASLSPSTISLDSDAWRFALFPNPSAALAALPTSLDNFGKPTCVPSNWQLTEPTPPVYSNFTYPFPHRLTNLSTHVSLTNNPTGIYARNFATPPFSEGGSVILILHGVCSCVQVFLNGQYIGYSEDSMTEAEFNLTPHLSSQGPNLLCLVVAQVCSGSYLEDQDMWRFSGVHRSVHLQLRRPDCVLWDYELEASFKLGVLSLTLDLNFAQSDAAQFLVKASLLDPASLEVLESRTARVVPVPSPPSAAPIEAPLPLPLRAVASLRLYARQALKDMNRTLEPWSPESPTLYPLLVELMGGPDGGITLQVEMLRVGFRDVEIEDSQLLLNGKPLTIRGVNRHEFDPNRGKVLSEASLLCDILQIKRHNFNAVRSCHYPQMHRWYDLCDHYGLLVCDEANIETHGFTLGGAISLLQFDSRFLDAFCSRVWACVLRARHHPSILCWSLGNESGFGPNLEKCARIVRHLDPRRPVVYEGGIKSGDAPLLLGDGQDPVSDLVCPMYHTPAQIASYASDPAEKRPVVLCEYGHMMGLSGGGLHLYWAYFNSPVHKQLQGGYVWDWVDQGLIVAKTGKKSEPSEPALRAEQRLLAPADFARAWFAPSEPDEDFWMSGRYGFGGDFGPDSGAKDAQFCCNGLVFPDRTAKPALREVKYLMAPCRFVLHDVEARAVTVKVEGEVDETWEFAWEAFEDGSTAAWAKGTLTGVVAEQQGRIEPEGWPPEDCSRVFLRVCARLGRAASWAEAGHEVAYEQWELAVLARDKWARVVPSPLAVFPSAAARAQAQDQVQVELQRDATVTARAGRYVAVVSLKTGELVELRDGESGRVLCHKVELCLRRACTDNDLGGADAHVTNAALIAAVPTRLHSLAARWRRAGLGEAVRVEALQHTFHAQDKRVVIECLIRAASSGHVLARERVSYVFLNDAVVLRYKLAIPAHSPLCSLSSLARVGLRFEAPAEMDRVTYCARGDFECYPDRKAGCKMGVYSCGVDDMHVPYIFPSENGGRADARWLGLRDDSGAGLLVECFCDDACPPEDDALQHGGVENQVEGLERPVGTRGAQMSVSRFSVEELDKARHQWELARWDELKQRSVKVHLDTAFCGIGGDVSWLPSVHPQYWVVPKAGRAWSGRLDLSVVSQGDKIRGGKLEQFSGATRLGGVLGRDYEEEVRWGC